MHEIRVSIVSPEAADHGVAELWAAGKLIGYTILEDTDLMLRIEPGRDRTPWNALGSTETGFVGLYLLSASFV